MAESHICVGAMSRQVRILPVLIVVLLTGCTGGDSGGEGVVVAKLERGQVRQTGDGGDIVLQVEESTALPVPQGLVTVVLSTGQGRVQFHEGGPTFKATIRAYGPTERDAEAVLRALRVDFRLDTREGFRLEANARMDGFPSDGWNRTRVDLSLYLPRDTAVASARLATGNGTTSMQLDATDLVMDTGYGMAIATGSVTSWTAQATVIEGWLDEPAASGRYDLQSTTHHIRVVVKQGHEHGLDVRAETRNGSMEFRFAKAHTVGTPTQTIRHVQTDEYLAKEVQTAIIMRSLDGDLIAADNCQLGYNCGYAEGSVDPYVNH